MKKVLALILTLVLCISVSVTVFAQEIFVGSVDGDRVIGVPDPITDGDITGDGKIDILDATALVKYLAGHDEGFDYSHGDYDQNGVINILDAIAVASFIVGG